MGRRDLDRIADPGDRAVAAHQLIQDAGKVAQIEYDYAVPILRAAVAELRAQGLSHREVAERIGISRARAQQLANG